MVWGDKNARINLRLPRETRRILDRLARESDPRMTVSEYVRALLVTHAERATKEEKRR